MFYFSLHKPTQTCRPPLKTSILSDQSQHRAAAGLHSSDLHREVCWDKTLSGTVKQDSSRGAIDCHSSERGDWLPEYFALQTSHFLCTQTRAHEENVWRAAMSDSYACRKRWVKRCVWGGGSASREVWWGSSGPPGQMAVPVGIRIKPPLHQIVSMPWPSKRCQVTISSLVFILLHPSYYRRSQALFSYLLGV